MCGGGKQPHRTPSWNACCSLLPQVKDAVAMCHPFLPVAWNQHAGMFCRIGISVPKWPGGNDTELKLGSNSSFGMKLVELSMLIADAVCFSSLSCLQNAGDFTIADAQLQPATWTENASRLGGFTVTFYRQFLSFPGAYSLAQCSWTMSLVEEENLGSQLFLFLNEDSCS